MGRSVIFRLSLAGKCEIVVYRLESGAGVHGCRLIVDRTLLAKRNVAVVV